MFEVDVCCDGFSACVFDCPKAKVALLGFGLDAAGAWGGMLKMLP